MKKPTAITLTWRSFLKQLPLTARYLKLHLAKQAYDYHNQKDMDAIWREIGPVIGIKGHADVDNLRFGLGYNPVTQLLEGYDKEKQELSSLYKAKYSLEQDAIRNGQGTSFSALNFNISSPGFTKNRPTLTAETSDELVKMLNTAKGHLKSTYAQFRAQYPKAAAALYRRHLSRQVETKLKALHARVIDELATWGKGAQRFSLQTRMHGHTQVTVALFSATQSRLKCSDTEEGQQWSQRIQESKKAIQNYLDQALKDGKARVSRAHYVTAQLLPKKAAKPAKKTAASKVKDKADLIPA